MTTHRYRDLRLGAALLVLGGLLACATPDPKEELAVSEFETYWVIDRVVGDNQFLAPTARFRVTNRGQTGRRAIEATGTFRRVGEAETWGSGWVRVLAPGKVLGPGESTVVVMVADTHYYSTGAAEQMFRHDLFKDASVELFLRLSGSNWVKMAEGPIERRVGARSIEPFVRPPAAAGGPPSVR
jgi:hypothetical protein